MRAKPTLILHNGRIWTADDSLPWAQSLAISGNHILAVGSDAEIEDSFPTDCRRIDLQQKLCLPGLWDAHIHFYYWSLGLEQVILAGCQSLQEMLQRVQENLGEHSGNAWSTGWGWNETFWEDSALPTRHDLDALTGLERPALFFRSDMHSAVANTAALALAGLLEPGREVVGGVIDRDSQGLPTGVLRELAINLVKDHVPAPTGEHTDRALMRGNQELHRLGITGICEQRMKDQEDGPKALAAFARLNRRKDLHLRVSCNIAAHNLPLVEALGVSSTMGDERLRLGHIKIFSDGTLGSRTAFMLEPFLPGSHDDHDDLGMMLTPPEQIASELQRAVDVGFPVSIHAIGDRANRLCLDLFEELRASGAEPPAVPHRLEHVQILADEDVNRLAQIGVTASLQPVHILDDMDTADAYLGDRADRAYRLKSLHESGVLLAFGSDAPVAEINPFHGIHGALYRQRPERMERGPWQPQEILGLEPTLKAYTIGAAQAAGWGRLTGSLQPGKKADLCVLDRDLFQLVESGVKGREIVDTQVVMTMFDGEIVHTSEDSKSWS
jgi:predicted amidohydrolase YtcJ